MAREQRVRRVPTSELTPAEIDAVRALLWAAFPAGDEAFTEEDWQHAVGGVHFILDDVGRMAAHASVVEREIHVADRPLKTGYVEAVATAPRSQGRGHGTRLMGDVNTYIRAGFELGALGTGAHHFYERLGWEVWRGPAYVRTPQGLLATPEDDGYIAVLRTPFSPPLDFT